MDVYHVRDNETSFSSCGAAFIFGRAGSRGRFFIQAQPEVGNDSDLYNPVSAYTQITRNRESFFCYLLYCTLSTMYENASVVSNGTHESQENEMKRKEREKV